MTKLKKTLLASCLASLLPASTLSFADTFPSEAHIYLEQENISNEDAIRSLLVDTDDQNNAVPPGTFRWNYDYELGTPVTVKYAFRTEEMGYLDSDNAAKREYAEHEKNGVKVALKTISESVGVTFNEVFSAEEADIIFEVTKVGDGANFPPSKENAGDTTFQRGVALSGENTLTYFNPNLGSEYGIYDNYQEAYATGISTVLHEVGHALGLKHPFDGNTLLPDEYNNKFFTVMAYNNGCSATYCFDPITLSKMDILALQYLYGKSAIKLNAGNDLYSYGDLYAYNQLLIDSDGEDTISLEDATFDSIVDLRSTAFSSIIPNPSFDKDEDTNEILARTFNNFSIHVDSQIENADGGSGNDVLVGNDLDNVLKGGAGNDTFQASLGNDEYFGGVGYDTVIYKGRYADYEVVENSGYISVKTISNTLIYHELMGIEKIQFSDQTLQFSEEVETGSGSDVTLKSNLVSSIGEDLNWAWLQIDGYDVETTGDDTSTIEFTVPQVAEEVMIRFSVVANDSKNYYSETITLKVNANVAPVLDDIENLTVNESEDVSLKAVANDSDENDRISYRWTQTAGPDVVLRNSTSSGMQFTAPSVSADQNLTFVVYASDGMLEVEKSVSVTVKNDASSGDSGDGLVVDDTDSSSGSGGSMGWILGLISLPLILRRKLSSQKVS